MLLRQKTNKTGVWTAIFIFATKISVEPVDAPLKYTLDNIRTFLGQRIVHFLVNGDLKQLK